MAKKDIIVIGTSAGGVAALKQVVGGLSSSFIGTIFIVMHTSTDSPALLAKILTSAGPLPASYAFSEETFGAGQIYIAPPDYHLLIEQGIMRLTRGPKENRFRPAVDPLFRSAALSYGPRVVGVVLTGGLDDGTAGLQAIKSMGGTAVVQDPDEAYARSMPASALRYVDVDHTLPVAEIGPLLVNLLADAADVEGAVAVPEDIEIEIRIANEERAIDAGVEKLGTPSCFACPECHGVLLQLTTQNPQRFRCHTGHAYTLDALMSEISEKTDNALWAAIRSLEEQALLVRHVGRHIQDGSSDDRSEEFISRAREIESRAQLVREATMSHQAKLRSG